MTSTVATDLTAAADAIEAGRPMTHGSWVDGGSVCAVGAIAAVVPNGFPSWLRRRLFSAAPHNRRVVAACAAVDAQLPSRPRRPWWAPPSGMPLSVMHVSDWYEITLPSRNEVVTLFRRAAAAEEGRGDCSPRPVDQPGSVRIGGR